MRVIGIMVWTPYCLLPYFFTLNVVLLYVNTFCCHLAAYISRKPSICSTFLTFYPNQQIIVGVAERDIVSLILTQKSRQTTFPDDVEISFVPTEISAAYQTPLRFQIYNSKRLNDSKMYLHTTKQYGGPSGSLFTL